MHNKISKQKHTIEEENRKYDCLSHSKQKFFVHSEPELHSYSEKSKFRGGIRIKQQQQQFTIIFFYSFQNQNNNKNTLWFN